MKKNKKIILTLIVILLIVFSFTLIFSKISTKQPLSVVSYNCFTTKSDALNFARAFEKAEGDCVGYCYVASKNDVSQDPTPNIKDKGQTSCSNPNYYNVWCGGYADEKLAGACGTNTLKKNECNVNLQDCSSGKRCFQYSYGTVCSTVSCPTAYKWDSSAQSCQRIGCESDSACPSGSCNLNLANKIYECKVADTISKDWGATAGGSFSSISFPTKVSPNSLISINGFFTPTKSGTYYIESGISESSLTPFTIVGKPGESCNGDKHFSGKSVFMSTGTPYEFILNIYTPTKPGMYKLTLGAYPGCNQKAFIDKQYDIQVGVSEATKLQLNPKENEIVVVGDNCNSDFTKTCSDTIITVFKCIEGKYSATDEICEDSDNTIIDNNNVVIDDIVCSNQFQSNINGSCKFDFNKFIKDTSVIYSGAALLFIIIIIVSLLFIKPKK